MRTNFGILFEPRDRSRSFRFPAAIAVAGFSVLFASSAGAYSSGVGGASGAGAFECISCHKSQVRPNVVVSTQDGLTTVDSAGLVRLSVRISADPSLFGPAAVGGLGVSVTNRPRGQSGSRLGGFEALGPGTRISSALDLPDPFARDVTQTAPKAVQVNSVGQHEVVFEFGWRAPVVAVDTTAYVHVNGLLGNGDMSVAGDGSRYSPLNLTINKAPPGEAILSQDVYGDDEHVAAGAPFQFDASQSLGFGLTYFWNFGDGTPVLTTTNAKPKHTYAQAGTYVVTVTVSDARGENGPNVTDQADVLVKALVADPGGPYGATVGQEIEFDGSGSSWLDPDLNARTIVDYRWTFGAGAEGCPPPPQTVNPRCKYGTKGIKTITLTVTDDRNWSHTATTTAAISPLGAPAVTTDSVTEVTQFSARFHGTVTTKDAGAEAYFQYTDDAAAAKQGDFSAFASTKSVTLAAPKTTSQISAEVVNLTCGQRYYYRAVAQDRGGNGLPTFASTRRFSTPPCSGGPPQLRAPTIVTTVNTPSTAQIVGLLPGVGYTFTVVVPPSTGATARVSSTGVVTYVPAGGYIGQDTFVVKVTDASTSFSEDLAFGVEVTEVAAAPAAPTFQSGAGSGAWGVFELVFGLLALAVLRLNRYLRAPS